MHKLHDTLERGPWKLTPFWMLWRARWRREVYIFPSERLKWEYADVPGQVVTIANFN